ncbi:MAG TPA: phosphotransferase [Mycobacteriales bacterium]|nr:phosphotransferase [Mycobacteriales bacterium]
MIEDPLLPAASVLLGDEAGELLAAAVDFAGGRLESTRPLQVQYYPGQSLAVLYDAVVEWPGRGRVGESLVAMTGDRRVPDGALLLEAEGLQVGLWRLPHDPALPGLAVARGDGSDGQRRLLGDDVEGPVDALTLSYRPARRAVVRLGCPTHRVYVKVVRPKKAAGVRDIHARLSAHLPSPRVRSADETLGLVVLEELPGESLVAAIARGAKLPGPDDLLELVDAIASAPTAAVPLVSARDDAVRLAGLLRRVLPDDAAVLDDVLARIGPEPEGLPATTIHGDLYDAQLLVDEGRITGVLDLDRAGPGQRSDDLARMLGHLDALAIFRPDVAAVATAYRDQLWAGFAATTDARDLAQRTAAVLVALATGPFAALQVGWESTTRAYLSGAAGWLDRAS